MKKLSGLVFGILIALVLCSCSRERIAIEEKADKTDDSTEWISEDNTEDSEKEEYHASNNEEEAPVKFRTNLYGEIDPPEECSKLYVAFNKAESKETVARKWNDICNLPGIKRTKVVTGNGGTFFAEMNKVNPSYLEYYVDGDEEIRKFVEENGLEFSVTLYASDDADEITMCMWRNTIEACHWKVEEWPFYIEENDVINLRYNDWLGDLQYRDITIQKIISTPPWYLNRPFDNTKCMIIIPDEQYREMFGEDHYNNKIRGLEGGLEWFYVQCEEGKTDEVRKKIEQMGVYEVGNVGFFKED